MQKVSIVMPAYNAAGFIAESIDSVIAQSFQDWELIIIDNGSTDNTKEVVAQFTRKDSRIKCINWQVNKKQGKARNAGIANSNYELIAFLDADDLWLPEKLAVQVKQINDLNVDLVFSNAYIFESLPVRRDRNMDASEQFLEGLSGVEKMLERNQVPILTVLVKKKALQAVGCFTEEVVIQNAEDYHLWLKLLIQGNRFYGSDQILAAYRVHNNAASTDNKLAFRQVVEALRDLMATFPDKEKLIRGYLKKWFLSYQYQKGLNQHEYKELIKKNCAYLGKPMYANTFLFLYSLLGKKVTRKIMLKSLNG